MKYIFEIGVQEPQKTTSPHPQSWSQCSAGRQGWPPSSSSPEKFNIKWIFKGSPDLQLADWAQLITFCDSLLVFFGGIVAIQTVFWSANNFDLLIFGSANKSENIFVGKYCFRLLKRGNKRQFMQTASRYPYLFTNPVILPDTEISYCILSKPHKNSNEYC